jgi:hypothetical protein
MANLRTRIRRNAAKQNPPSRRHRMRRSTRKKLVFSPLNPIPAPRSSPPPLREAARPYQWWKRFSSRRRRTAWTIAHSITAIGQWRKERSAWRVMLSKAGAASGPRSWKCTGTIRVIDGAPVRQQ